MGKWELCSPLIRSSKPAVLNLLMLGPVNTGPHVVLTPNHKIIFVAT